MLYVGREAFYTVTICNLLGARVRRLYEGTPTRGLHHLPWRGLDDRRQAVASGVYLVRAEGDGMTELVKATLLR